MARMKIELPKAFAFTHKITVRATDLNYGNHLGNQVFLAYAQEARLNYFQSFGFDEMDFGGVSLIQADAAIVYKGEAHLNDQVKIDLAAVQAGSSSFNVYYRFMVEERLIAEVRTAIVCFDYQLGKPVPIPEAVLERRLFTS